MTEARVATDWHPDIPIEYRNQIVTGDAFDLVSMMPDESIELMIIDPPYYLPAQSYVGARGKGYVQRKWSDMSILGKYFRDFFDDFSRVLSPASTAYVFCDAQSYPVFYRAMLSHFKRVRILIWDKIVSYNGYTWRHQHELIAWGEGYEAKRIPTGDGDVLTCRGVLQEDRHHAAEKPTALIMQLIQKHSADIVLDAFAGSGSVAVAAKESGRGFVAFELDPDTARLARARVQRTQPPLTGLNEAMQQAPLFAPDNGKISP